MGLAGIYPDTYNQIAFAIGTGGDDLRGDSSATATLQAANGSTLELVTLKRQGDPGWENNTTHTVTAPLNPALAPSAIVHIVITLTSHNSLGETSDNWNVQSVAVMLSNNGDRSAVGGILAGAFDDSMLQTEGSRPASMTQSLSRRLNCRVVVERSPAPRGSGNRGASCPTLRSSSLSALIVTLDKAHTALAVLSMPARGEK